MSSRKSPEGIIHRAVIEWRIIPSWGNYSASSCGLVRGPRKLLKQFPSVKGYLTVQISQNGHFTTIGVARLIAMAFLPDFDSSLQVDHIDGDKSNNNFTNLRMATNSENAKNRPLYKTNSLGLKGVSFHKKSRRYVARIQVDGRRIALGEFRTSEEAAAVYRRAAEVRFGKFNRRENLATT